MELKEKLENIIWHIEANRDISGDKRILDDVLLSLKKIVNEKK